MRKVKLQPSEIACLILSVMVITCFWPGAVRLLRRKYSQLACVQVSALANACGVGGGAFFVPMFNILLGFSMYTSGCITAMVHTSFPGVCVTITLL